MKVIIFAFTFFALFAITLADYKNCLHKAHFSAFNLCPFAKPEGSAPQFTPSFSPPSSKVLTLGLGSNHVKTCNNTVNIWAKFTDGNVCTEIATQDPKFSLLDSTNSSKGVLITFPPEKDELDHNNQLIVQLKCNKDETKVAQTDFKVTTDSNATHTYYYVEGESRFGCPAVSFEQLINFIASNNIVFSIVFGVIGVVLNFFGLKFINFAIFSITSTAGTMISGMFFYQFLDVTAEQWTFWLLFVGCLVLGLLLGYVALKLEKVAVFCIGSVLGFIAGDLLYVAIISPFLSTTPNPNIFRVVIILCVLIVGSASLLLFEPALIAGTSLIGSYFFVRSISTFIGHFPAEINVAEGISQFDIYAYGYIVAILVFTVIGIRFQIKTKDKLKKEIEDPEENVPRNGYAYYKY